MFAAAVLPLLLCDAGQERLNPRQSVELGERVCEGEGNGAGPWYAVRWYTFSAFLRTSHASDDDRLFFFVEK